MDKFGSKWLYGEIWWLTFLMSLPLVLLGMGTGLLLGRLLWCRFKQAWQKSENECRDLQDRLSAIEEDQRQTDDDTRQDKQTLHEQADRLKALEAKHLELTGEMNRVKRSNAGLEVALETARSDRDELSALVHKYRQDGQQSAPAQAELAQARARIEALTEELQEAEHRTSRLGTEVQLMSTIRTEFAALRNDNEDLLQELEDLRGQGGATEEFTRHLEIVTTERDEWQAAAQAASEESARWREELDLLQRALAATPTTPHDLPPLNLPEAAGDALTKIEGISESLATQLQSLGVDRFLQVAQWDRPEIDRIAEGLGLADQIERERWREQAAILHEEKYGEEVQPPAIVEATAEVAGAPEEDGSEPPACEEAHPHGSNGHSPEAKIDPELGIVFPQPPPDADDLTRIKGIADTLENRLHGYGVYHYRQIALWSDENMEAFSKRLSFRDRIQRDQWREQSQHLHEEKYGEILSPS